MTGSSLLHKRLGTRASKLALIQAQMVREAFRVVHGSMEVEIVSMTTMGDRILDRSLIELGGKGLFVKEIEEALLAGDTDLAVHSYKDMPAFLPEGLIIGAVLQREDARDALIAPGFGNLLSLPPEARVGTASPRRQAQMKRLRPDLHIQSLRGNVETRLRKIKEGQADATVLAVAGLKRLGLLSQASHIFSPDEMLPAVAQGAICIECRRDDAHMRELLAKLNHIPTEIAVAAERACLRVLEGSCRTPIAAYAVLLGEEVFLQALIAKPDGSQLHHAQGKAAVDDADELGKDIGLRLRHVGGPDFFR